jgi:hypothetical protein
MVIGAAVSPPIGTPVKSMEHRCGSLKLSCLSASSFLHSSIVFPFDAIHWAKGNRCFAIRHAGALLTARASGIESQEKTGNEAVTSSSVFCREPVKGAVATEELPAVDKDTVMSIKRYANFIAIAPRKSEFFLMQYLTP